MASVFSVLEDRRKRLNKYLESSRNRSLFVASITFMFFVIFVVFGIIPSFRTVIAQHRENQEIEEEIQKAQKKISDLDVMITQRQQKQDLINLFNDYFPNDINQEPVIGQIWGLAQSNEIFINQILYPETPTTQEANEEISVLPNVKAMQITIEAEGSRERLQSFLQDIEASRRIYNITGITLTRKPIDEIRNEGFEKEYNLRLIVNYFYWLDEISE